jgi:thiamine biosynthesis protein ThiS
VKIRLNGAERDTSAPTIASLLEELRLPRQTVLVEQNGEARRRDEWEAAPLGEGDTIEVMRVAAGG